MRQARTGSPKRNKETLSLPKRQIVALIPLQTPYSPDAPMSLDRRGRRRTRRRLVVPGAATDARRGELRDNSDSFFLGWRNPSIVVRLSRLRARARQTSAAADNEGSDCSGGNPGRREALAHNRRNSARSALYLAPARLHSEPRMTARPSRVQTDHFHLPRPRRFSSISNDAKLYPRSDMSRRESVCEAAMEFVEQS
jgi:hypothetical protein